VGIVVIWGFLVFWWGTIPFIVFAAGITIANSFGVPPGPRLAYIATMVLAAFAASQAAGFHQGLMAMIWMGIAVPAFIANGFIGNAIGATRRLRDLFDLKNIAEK